MLALPMNNTLPFAESILCWCLANYAFGSDPVRPNQGAGQIPERTITSRWFASIALRSIVSALLLAAASGFTSMSIYIAAAIVAGALILPIVRARFVPLRSLAEFELGPNGIAVLLLWRICLFFPHSNCILLALSNQSQSTRSIIHRFHCFHLHDSRRRLVRAWNPGKVGRAAGTR